LETLREDELLALASAALEGLGLPREDALDAARILVMGDLLGIATHGVSRLESYGERLLLGGINARADIRVEKVAATIAKLDGDNGVGTLVGYRALQAAMAMARESGTGIVFARSSNHFGPIAPYNYLAAQEGFASVIGSNSSPTIAPWGGREARVGNSPIGFGIPNPGARPIILDMASSVVARAKIRDALKARESIPETWATDRDGKPTRDPKAALDGFLLPIGGYKGYGLALIVDLFAGVLSGAAYLTRVQSWIDVPEEPQNLGHFFFLVDTARLGDPAWLAERIADFTSLIRSTPLADPSQPIRLPGEIELDRLERHRRDGIPIDVQLRDKMIRFAALKQEKAP
jgi:LDH2 family malate/lactate/ureidoglycolate dehydrogenase